jgi:hypothetical protein
MQIPTEEQIEAVISELQVGSNIAHHVEGKDECELCTFLQEITNRAKKKRVGVPAIDTLSMNILEKPEFFITKLVAGDGLAEDVIYYIRTAFYIGLKAGFVIGMDHKIEEE